MSNNTTYNDQLCTLYLLNSATSEIVMTVALGVLGIFSLAGNALVLAVLYRNREMRTITNLFIANMAVSDLIFPLVVIPKEIAFIHSDHFWLIKGDFGSFLCKLVHFLQDLSTSISILSHVAISIERFYAVVFPLKARRSSVGWRTVAVVMTWVVAMGYNAPYFYSFRLVLISKEERTFRCILQWEPAFDDTNEAQKRFYMFSFVSHYAIPLVVITVLYSYILYKIKARQVVGNDYANRSVRDNTQNKRIVRLAISIVLLFAISWAPLHIFLFIHIYKWNWSIPCGLENLAFSTFYLAWLSSFTNPLIYFIFSENYRNGLKNLFGGCFVIHPRIFPGISNVVGIETTESTFLEHRGARVLRHERNAATNEETVT
ncbi:QRFP-like peptide receptor [Actinia tenebrosa]|uniref:QRFP-like peptide receptor n=1 Tax=Actinia tenebrosa TaxID=6105 RepID=A0A6P8ILV8_ACTTE|nr:QRFP-like peptide receptor [Actinia tenebrosa]XP_031567606.1 QRFP-like peptide receptor [Actinia tenebrosa]XP_031567607.1 QRFP-like peptide receptor [Actinia tenebrosa]